MGKFVEGRNRREQLSIELLNSIQLLNVTEIEVLQEVIFTIDIKYAQKKANLEPALVCALLLNHQQVPSLYATTSRGYNKQKAEYRKHYQTNIQENLLPWAIKQVLELNISRTLAQDEVIAENASMRKILAQSWREIEGKGRSKGEKSDIFDVLANLSLTNLVEQEVIKDAHSHIKNDYDSNSDRINLSDVCALVLNNEYVPTLYATNAKEYNQLKQIYITQHQTKVRQIIRGTVKQVNLEGSEHSFSQNNMAKNAANLRNINSWDS